MTAKPMSRLVHQAFPYRNELATTGDRIESAVLVLGVAAALLAVPVAGAAGSESYAAQRERVAVEQASRTRADAVLIEDAPATYFHVGNGRVGGGHVRDQMRQSGHGHVVAGLAEVDLVALPPGSTLSHRVDARRMQDVPDG